MGTVIDYKCIPLQPQGGEEGDGEAYHEGEEDAGEDYDEGKEVVPSAPNNRAVSKISGSLVLVQFD